MTQMKTMTMLSVERESMLNANKLQGRRLGTYPIIHLAVLPSPGNVGRHGHHAFAVEGGFVLLWQGKFFKVIALRNNNVHLGGFCRDDFCVQRVFAEIHLAAVCLVYAYCLHTSCHLSLHTLAVD